MGKIAHTPGSRFFTSRRAYLALRAVSRCGTSGGLPKGGFRFGISRGYVFVARDSRRFASAYRGRNAHARFKSAECTVAVCIGISVKYDVTVAATGTCTAVVSSSLLALSLSLPPRPSSDTRLLLHLPVFPKRMTMCLEGARMGPAFVSCFREEHGRSCAASVTRGRKKE